jgi:phosphoribosylanthranilate isomerase
LSVRVKLCGLANEDALRAVGDARPDAVGFVLAPSPRRVDVDTLTRLLAWVPDGVERWAVFRTPDEGTLSAIAALPLTGVQADATWDGRGLPERLAWLPVFADGPDLVERVRSAGFDGRSREVRGLVGAFVVDSARGGGSGERVDVARAVAAARLGPLVLAGGLRPENVGEAVEAVRPWAVDVSSGVESAPGVKDPGRIAAFVAAARGT